jgi:hypothetical protein
MAAAGSSGTWFFSFWNRLCSLVRSGFRIGFGEGDRIRVRGSEVSESSEGFSGEMPLVWRESNTTEMSESESLESAASETAINSGWSRSNRAKGRMLFGTGIPCFSKRCFLQKSVIFSVK